MLSKLKGMLVEEVERDPSDTRVRYRLSIVITRMIEADRLDRLHRSIH